MERAQELERKLEALQLEVARKTALLQTDKPLHEVLIADLQKLLEFAQDSKIRISSSVSNETSYVALRELFVKASQELERSALKICVGFESSANNPEARKALLQSMLGPLEIVVTSLSSTQHGGAVSVLQLACRNKAKEVCLSCIALVKALFQEENEVSVAALAGAVESLCHEIRLLPVSNLAAVKRQVFELCKTTVQDTSREFLQMHEDGGEVDFFGDDDEGEEEELETEDIQRLQHASKCFDSLKQVLLAVCKQGLDGFATSTQDLEWVSQQCHKINTVCTDFAMEMYPKQDLGLITVQATMLRNLVEDLVQRLGGHVNEQLVEDFTQKLNLVVV